MKIIWLFIFFLNVNYIYNHPLESNNNEFKISSDVQKKLVSDYIDNFEDFCSLLMKIIEQHLLEVENIVGVLLKHYGGNLESISKFQEKEELETFPRSEIKIIKSQLRPIFTSAVKDISPYFHQLFELFKTISKEGDNIEEISKRHKLQPVFDRLVVILKDLNTSIKFSLDKLKDNLGIVSESTTSLRAQLKKRETEDNSDSVEDGFNPMCDTYLKAILCDIYKVLYLIQDEFDELKAILLKTIDQPHSIEKRKISENFQQNEDDSLDNTVEKLSTLILKIMKFMDENTVTLKKLLEDMLMEILKEQQEKEVGFYQSDKKDESLEPSIILSLIRLIDPDVKLEELQNRSELFLDLTKNEREKLERCWDFLESLLDKIMGWISSTKPVQSTTKRVTLPDLEH